MKDIFTLFNEQNPPEKTNPLAGNVVLKDAEQERAKVAIKDEPNTEPKTEPNTEPKTEPTTEQKTEPPAKTSAEQTTEKGGVENGTVQHNPAEPVSA